MGVSTESIGRTLETYAYKILDSKPIEDIEVQDVIRVLKPIWIKKTVTAQRVMQRIAKVIGMAKSLKLYHKRFSYNGFCDSAKGLSSE